MKNEAVKDSGSTQEFNSGAHRDNSAGKGDCSLLPLKEVAEIMEDAVLAAVDNFMETRDTKYLAEAVRESVNTLYVFNYLTIYTQMQKDGIEMMGMSDGNPERMRKAQMKACLGHMMIEASKIYQAGAEKYGRNNWKLGMPVDRYIDSGVRHYLKTIRGDIDEPHYRGFVWNLLCAMWTANNIPELNQKSVPVRSTVQAAETPNNTNVEEPIEIKYMGKKASPEVCDDAADVDVPPYDAISDINPIEYLEDLKEATLIAEYAAGRMPDITDEMLHKITSAECPEEFAEICEEQVNKLLLEAQATEYGRNAIAMRDSDTIAVMAGVYHPNVSYHNIPTPALVQIFIEQMKRIWDLNNEKAKHRVRLTKFDGTLLMFDNYDDMMSFVHNYEFDMYFVEEKVGKAWRVIDARSN